MQKYVYEIRFYYGVAIASLLALFVVFPFTITNPREEIYATLHEFYDAIIEMNLGVVIANTHGQLRNNYTLYRSQIEEMAREDRYFGVMTDMQVQVLDVRDNWARATVRVIAEQQGVHPLMPVERIFDAELTRVSGQGWKVVSSVQHQLRVLVN